MNTGRAVYPCRPVTRGMAKDSDSELQTGRSDERGAECYTVQYVCMSVATTDKILNLCVNTLMMS